MVQYTRDVVMTLESSGIHPNQVPIVLETEPRTLGMQSIFSSPLVYLPGLLKFAIWHFSHFIYPSFWHSCYDWHTELCFAGLSVVHTCGFLWLVLLAPVLALFLFSSVLFISCSFLYRPGCVYWWSRTLEVPQSTNSGTERHRLLNLQPPVCKAGIRDPKIYHFWDEDEAWLGPHQLCSLPTPGYVWEITRGCAWKWGAVGPVKWR